MLQNLQGEPLPGFIGLEVQRIVSSRASEAFAREITLTTLEGLLFSDRKF